ncbi:phosphoglycerate mutase family protein [Evansella sp. AB-P1]|uniref:histidine phosphatase family protein n=1 Tax=Evansella sp. AB-P1 TaxID=3037653 RepID=UPI00241E2CA7|nr:histidine phosphatase family protein [Evansella sp. AB-P1]MDG5786226.1 phosphoglycerate mutase family protein [Evansella sp. AB-P1]
MQKIYIIRHCKAEGQPAESRLTDEGVNQSYELAEFFTSIPVNRIISSPYTRAVDSIKPLSNKKDINIEIDQRLVERVLSTEDLPDWMEKLEETFHNKNLKFPGGESSEEALSRIVGVIDDIVQSDVDSSVIVTHGNLMALLLNYFDHQFGFDQWKLLTNPDVFLLTLDKKGVNVKGIWND